MVNMTIAIPNELHKLMREHDEIKWSEVVRKALWEKAKRVEIVESIMAKSKATDLDVEELSRKIKKDIARSHGL
jgi:hypothetical protein